MTLDSTRSRKPQLLIIMIIIIIMIWGRNHPAHFLLHVLICLFTLAVLVVSVFAQRLAHLDFDISVFIIDSYNTMF